MTRWPPNENLQCPVGREVSFNLSQGKITDVSHQDSFGGGWGASCVIPKVASVRELADEIRKGDVECLRLHGFDHVRHLRESDMEILFHALEENTSIVEVSMGWSIQERSVALLLEKIASLANLRRLSLKSFTWISENSLDKIVSNSSLQELEFQGVWVRTSSGEGRRTIVHSLVEMGDAMKCKLSGLRLIRCSLRDDDCVKLCSFSRKHQSGLKELSIRGNRFVTGVGLAALMQARVVRLDVSDCALSSGDLVNVVQTAEKDEGVCHGGPKELILACNRNISTSDSGSFLSFTELCVASLKVLDLSECSIREQDLMCILQMLQRDACRLESFLCEGHFSVPVQEIAELLVKNRTLSSFALSTSRDEYDSKLEKRSCFAQSLKSNYNLHSLQINCCGTDIIVMDRDDLDEEQPDATVAEIDFLLRLNRAGRKILLEDGCASHPAVLREILQKSTTQGDDVLFWFLQNGLSTHFVQGVAN